MRKRGLCSVELGELFLNIELQAGFVEVLVSIASLLLESRYLVEILDIEFSEVSQGCFEDCFFSLKFFAVRVLVFEL